MMKQKTSNIVAVVFGILTFISCQSAEQRLCEKLQGLNNIELENSEWGDAYDDILLDGCLVSIWGDSIELPTVSYSCDTAMRLIHEDSLIKHPELEPLYKRQIDSLAAINQQKFKDAKGIWKIISTSPDSIFIVAPNHPMNGSYLVEFFYDEAGWTERNAPNNKYKFILLNEKDEKYFILNRAGFIFGHKYNHWTN